jgi:hypothetical protein
MNNASDPEFQVIASISALLRTQYIQEGALDPWEGSPFAWIRTLRSRQIGKVGEQLVAGWCAAKGLDVVNSPDSEADRIIGGRRIEIKLSTLWASGIYKFQQIREQNYEYAICLGISPFDAHCWVIPKDLLRQFVIGHTPQHKGSAGTDTFWISVTPTNPPEWLVPTGGTLARAFEELKHVTQK